jgi:HSP20 family protein
MFSTYNMFDEMLDLRNVIERFFDENPVTAARADFPPVNLYEEADGIEVTAFMPGVRADSLNLQLLNQSLVIEGEKKSDLQEKPYVRRERTFGTFQKSVRLPFKVDPGSVEATLRDGVLTVRLTKAPEARAKKIEVK